MKNVVALIQVRMGSSRVPGKALIPLCGRPLLGHLLDRVRSSALVDDVVVATSNLERDDCIEQFCCCEKVSCVRGSEDDVCKRMNTAVQMHPAHHYLRFCGDAPMQDKVIISEVIRLHLDSGADYTTNGVDEERTFPLGLDVRIARRELFIDSLRERGDELRNRENPLAFVHENRSGYNLATFKATGQRLRPELRFVADYPEDVRMLGDVFDALYPIEPLFGCKRAIDYVDGNPSLKRLMNSVKDQLSRRTSATSSDTSYIQKCV